MAGKKKMYDVIIIGSGVSGCASARELSRYKVKVCVLEKEEDVIKNWAIDATFKPSISEEDREKCIKGWNKAVKYAYGWARED